ncbi:FAD-dependent oxidoreductase [Rhodopirellula sp. P2]|uniref:FAD-dependent oxidoreductase n=1 Tax=Rhodopirellula sp. P2 TaxID=2127060 RepID=UPI002367C8D0|nr:FAD-dependent oxidoreductase [Rhodopirellula sp. P2]WDQ15913.1 FAD-dependent oxidoreductase [Rhodopirellula sp. P2]
MNSQPRRLRYTRRDLLSSVLGVGSLACAGCDSLSSRWSGALPFAGAFLSPNREIGHRLRVPTSERLTGSSDATRRRASCVIVGGGVAGLAAGYELLKSGVDDFLVLELESSPGGTSRSTQYTSESFGSLRAPWGAHYLPLPGPRNAPLQAFLRDCGVLDEHGVAAEQMLCRDPEERVWANDRWQSGLLPMRDATPEDVAQIERFQTEMSEFALRTGNDGKPWFVLPTSHGTNDPEPLSLDQISMQQWMQNRAFDSPRLLWLVDHSCRDDYGLRAGQTSAWAGIFYFAARLLDASQSPDSAPVLTWPEGNGFLVDQLAQRLGDRIETDRAVLSMTEDEPGTQTLHVLDTQTQQSTRITAESVILAVPQFIACRLLDDSLGETKHERIHQARSFQYGSWLVANIVLKDRPTETDSWMCWDNVRYQSTSLGYVNAGHQTGRDHGGTVITWYQALTGDNAALTRTELLNLTWDEAAEVVCSDLEVMHPDIRQRIETLDIMVWGHAMIQPTVGSRSNLRRVAASQAIGNVHFAASDLSGVALFEEAFDHGRRAAKAVVASWS